ncbi:hypothetical protein [Aliagarivorans taiwanensis]|uniref:hypothetical protein n=1 Tax=Aliagarivorans taiwanensis TaxID=561966 RepID=UPI00047CAD39|nr:hypothetical protein [Aliagarivorans taiwanensis]
MAQTLTTNLRLTLAVGLSALLAACNSSETVNENPQLRFVAEQSDLSGYCELPDLEILVHTPEGEYHNTLRTNNSGLVSLTDIPQQHLATVAPHLTNHTEGVMEFISEQQEALIKLSASGGDYSIGTYVENYPGELGNCYDYPKLTVQVENPDNLLTDPQIRNGYIELAQDVPGIVVYEQYDDNTGMFSASGYVSRDQLSQDEVLVLSDIPLVTREPFNLTLEAELSFIAQGPFTNGYQFSQKFADFLQAGAHQLSTFTDPLQSHLAAVQFEDDDGQNITHVKNWLNTDQDVNVPDLSTPEFQLIDVSPDAITYQLDGLEPELVVAGLHFKATNENGEEASYYQYVLLLSNSGTIVLPKVDPLR